MKPQQEERLEHRRTPQQLQILRGEACPHLSWDYGAKRPSFRKEKGQQGRGKNSPCEREARGSVQVSAASRKPQASDRYCKERKHQNHGSSDPPQFSKIYWCPRRRKDCLHAGARNSRKNILHKELAIHLHPRKGLPSARPFTETEATGDEGVLSGRTVPDWEGEIPTLFGRRNPPMLDAVIAVRGKKLAASETAKADSRKGR